MRPPRPRLSVALFARVATAMVVAAGLLVAATPAAHAEGPAEGAAARDVAPLPACRYDDVVVPDARYDAWAKTLVDTIYRLPDTYRPPDLRFVGIAGLAGDGYVRSFVIPDLSALVDAARADGVELRAVSAYRSAETQAELLAQSERDSGEQAALALTARPGHSEHQLGTTLDFGPRDGSAPWDGDWGTSPEGRWLSNNGWRYGFVLSYPKDGSPATTCYSYEPWHYRYFGRDVARQIHESGLTPRAFLWDEAQVPAKSGGSGAGRETAPAQANGAASTASPPEASDVPASGAGTYMLGVNGLAPGIAACGGGIVLGALMWRRNRGSRRRRARRVHQGQSGG